MPGDITEHADIASLLRDPAAVADAFAFLRALERLEVVLVVNGLECRGAIRWAEDNAVIEVVINTPEP